MKTETHDTQINDAWETLFQASDELKAYLRRQPAKVYDFEFERLKRLHAKQLPCTEAAEA